MTGSPLFELQHVTHVFGGRERFTALKDACLRLHEGEFVVLVGPSGCGKSTLLRILTGLLPPTEGHVLYRGQPLHGVNPHVTLVFQTFALFPWLTVQQNVEVALKARGVPPAERTARATELLDRVGLDGFESAYPRELSGGMRQKVGFARAMAVEPELLCLDEPFSSLDVLSAEALRRELLELWTGGKIPTKTILMVTHNIEEAVLLADRIVIMAKTPGRVVTELPVDLPHPRRHKTTAFLALVDEVYGLLATQAPSARGLPAPTAGEAGYIRGLPAITIHDLAGLVPLFINTMTYYSRQITHRCGRLCLNGGAPSYAKAEPVCGDTEYARAQGTRGEGPSIYVTVSRCHSRQDHSLGRPGGLQ